MIKYGDKVKVLSGFYEGCVGIVIECNKYCGAVVSYSIEIRKKGFDCGTVITIKELDHNLAKVEV